MIVSFNVTEGEHARSPQDAHLLPRLLHGSLLVPAGSEEIGGRLDRGIGRVAKL
jgi:hypothetical protein